MNQAFKVGDIVKVKNPKNRTELYRELKVDEVDLRGRVSASGEGVYVDAPFHYFELVRSSPTSQLFTEEQVKQSAMSYGGWLLSQLYNLSHGSLKDLTEDEIYAHYLANKPQ